MKEASSPMELNELNKLNKISVNASNSNLVSGSVSVVKL